MDTKGQEPTRVRLDLSEELYSSIPFEIHGMLSPESKALLTVPTEQRTGGHFLNLITELEDMEFFRRFPTVVKEHIGKYLLYSNHPAHTMLLRQDGPVKGVFILSSGAVALKHSDWPENVLRRGDVFGHHDLLRNRQSSIDAYTLGYSEVLILPTDHVDEAVRNVLEPETERLERRIRTSTVLPWFGWSEKELRALPHFCHLERHLSLVEIYDGHDPKFATLLVSGECKIVREVRYTASTSRVGPVMTRLYKPARSVHQRGLMKKSLILEKVRQGFYFGVGEDFSSNKVFSTPGAECLKIPRLLLLFKDKVLLERMRRDLVQSLPNDVEVLESFAWHEAAVKEVEELLCDMLKEKPHRLVSRSG